MTLYTIGDTDFWQNLYIVLNVENVINTLLVFVNRPGEYIGVVADEVYTGGGRTGSFFACLPDDVNTSTKYMPDAIVMGKGFCPCALLRVQGETLFEWKQSVTSEQSLDVLRSWHVRPFIL